MYITDMSAFREYGLACPNVFANVFIPDDEKASTRLPIPERNLVAIQKECVELDDDVRWLVALISDTGMRLAEAAGLLVSDIKLDADVPHIALCKHPWRSLKTRGSERDIPLATLFFISMNITPVMRYHYTTLTN